MVNESIRVGAPTKEDDWGMMFCKTERTLEQVSETAVSRTSHAGVGTLDADRFAVWWLRRVLLGGLMLANYRFVGEGVKVKLQYGTIRCHYATIPSLMHYSYCAFICF